MLFSSFFLESNEVVFLFYQQAKNKNNAIHVKSAIRLYKAALHKVIRVLTIKIYLLLIPLRRL